MVGKVLIRAAAAAAKSAARIAGTAEGIRDGAVLTTESIRTPSPSRTQIRIPIQTQTPRADPDPDPDLCRATLSSHPGHEL